MSVFVERLKKMGKRLLGRRESSDLLVEVTG